EEAKDWHPRLERRQDEAGSKPALLRNAREPERGRKGKSVEGQGKHQSRQDQKVGHTRFVILGWPSRPDAHEQPSVGRSGGGGFEIRLVVPRGFEPLAS